MITENMALNTARDADLWASEMLENVDHTDSDKSTLSDWIWNNRPETGCTLSEHPISDMSTDEMCALFE